jgi:hypothetical protein
MTMYHSDPDRESESRALEDIEVFQVPEDYELEADENGEYAPGWYWWSCSPGCLPDGAACGPFESEAEALDDAREDLREC